MLQQLHCIYPVAPSTLLAAGVWNTQEPGFRGITNAMLLGLALAE